MRQILKFLLFAIVIAVTACDDNKTTPVAPVEPEESEHLFYISPFEGNMIKVFSVEQSAIIDSFIIDSVAVADTMRLHVIGNDSLLAVSAGLQTFIYDIKNRVVVESFEARYPLFSRDSKYYHYFNYGTSKQELRTFPEHALVFDGANGLFPKFDNDSRYLSLPDLQGSGSNLMIYDIVGDSTFIAYSNSQGNPVFVWMNYPSSRYNKIYIGGTTISSYFAGVIDIGLDSMFSVKQYSQSAVIPLLGPNDTYFYFAENIQTVFGGIQEEKIYVFDANSIDSVGIIEYSGMEQVGGMVITADSKYMLVKPYNEFQNVSNVCLIDANNFQVIGVFDVGMLPYSISTNQGAKNCII